MPARASLPTGAIESHWDCVPKVGEQVGGRGCCHHRAGTIASGMSTAIKCKRCGKIIVRNVKGEWQLPKSVVPTTKCTDGEPHEPDRGPGSNDQSGLVMGVAIGASIYDAGII